MWLREGLGCDVLTFDKYKQIMGKGLMEANDSTA